MQETGISITPRTATDIVFDHLQDQILSLKLLPGTKISEAEIAGRMGISRQPVRDAFNRLGNLDLLSIRPQRATRVRGFSMKKIENARFVRLAVELEVTRRACAIWDDTRAAALEENIARQRAACAAGQVSAFHALDYRFHKLICDLGGQALAFETVTQCKLQVDRLCVLSLARDDEVSAVLADHRDIALALAGRDTQAAERVVRRHLGRLDDTINDIHKKHSEYFE